MTTRSDFALFDREVAMSYFGGKPFCLTLVYYDHVIGRKNSSASLGLFC